MSEYKVLKPIDSNNAGRILQPGETYTANLSDVEEARMIEERLIKRLKSKPAAKSQKATAAKSAKTAVSSASKTEEVKADGSN
jgi:TATA-binding protein-associated factor Taf7